LRRRRLLRLARNGAGKGPELRELVAQPRELELERREPCLDLGRPDLSIVHRPKG
jgi:hypothetical protein